MIDKNLFDVLYWWKGVTSCLNSGDNVCVSGALGVLSVLCLISSSVTLLCCRCKMRYSPSSNDVACVLYSLVGNVCNVAGAALSNQLPVQIIVASFMAALDGLHFISVTVPVCLWYHSKTGTRARMISRRRRQNSLVVCLLFVMGGCVYLGKGVQHSQPLGNRSPTGRRLLAVFLHSRIELLGYALGLLSFAISWTSRFPSLLIAKRGEQSDGVHASSRALSAVAAALYASAILLYDTRLECVVRALPWTLSAACAAALDAAILVLSCSRTHCSRHSVPQLDSATQSLLSSSHRPDSAQYHNPRDQTVRKHHLFARKSNSPKMTEMGHYMDVNVQPVRKVCLKEVTLTGESSAENQPLTKSVKVVRVDERYSSDSATDSSSLSSELQWDFEEATPQWGSGKGDVQTTDTFPLQEWMVSHSSGFSSVPASHTCFCNSAELQADMVVPTSLDHNLSCFDSVK
ncbi:transmembrane protein 44 [Brachyhypopomus gauderio]|uniref:transmembrane protein 44 n=1 Tax=Brachyhypopomus gauderio TaxID=698409 RepID=UPI004041334B